MAKSAPIDTSAIKRDYDRLSRGIGVGDAMKLVGKIPALLNEIDQLRRQPRLFEVAE
jgi:hypothetical protein